MDVEQTPSPSESGPVVPEKSDGRKPCANLFFPILIAIFLLVASSLAYYAWIELNKRLDQAAVHRQSLVHDIATVDEGAEFLNFKKELQERVSALDQQLIEFTEQLKEQANQQESIYRLVHKSLAQVNRSQLGWGLSEALHVLHMANHRLLIERDITGTIAALNFASARLHELNDPRLLPIRESISRQIRKLKNAPVPDWVGTSLQLNNILNGIRQDIDNARPVRQPRLESRGTDSLENKPTPWQKLTRQAKEFIDNSIKITRKGQQSKLLVNGQEKYLVYEFLRARLLSAQYALASRDNQSYHHELETAMAWLGTSTPLIDMSDLVDELGDLNSVNLKPVLPDISEPSILLAELLEKIESR